MAQKLKLNSFISLNLLFVMFSALTEQATGILQEEGCMSASATYFTNNFPLNSEELIEYIDRSKVDLGELPPCPLESPPNSMIGSTCDKCTLPGKGDKKCCDNGVCPCLKVKDESTCGKLSRPLIFNQQFFTVNESCYGVYFTWSIFDKTNNPGPEQEFTILPVVDKTTLVTTPILNKYIYVTGFGAKNIDGYYVTYYAHFRICFGTLARLLNLNFKKSPNPGLLDDLIGLDDCKCELEKPFTSASFYSAKPDEFNLADNTELFTFIDQTSINPPEHSFEPKTAGPFIKCIDKSECATIECMDNALVKCCVSGICKCVSNPDKMSCLPCSKNGVFVAQTKHCNSLGEDYEDVYSINKKKDNCNNNVKDTPFSATLFQDQDPSKGFTAIVGELVHSNFLSYQFTWRGVLRISPTTILQIENLLKK